MNDPTPTDEYFELNQDQGVELKCKNISPAREDFSLCPNCGTAHLSKNRLCPYCGKPLDC